MTSLDDRVTRLENAFVELVPLVSDLTEGQNRLEVTQSRMLETQNRMLETQNRMLETQNRMLEVLQEHSDLLRSIVSTLQQHSADLTIIKGYLEHQG